MRAWSLSKVPRRITRVGRGRGFSAVVVASLSLSLLALASLGFVAFGVGHGVSPCAPGDAPCTAVKL